MRPSLDRSFVLMLLFLTGCEAVPQTQPQETAISAAEAVARAEASARRVHLPGDLKEAGANTKKLAQVYRDADELDSTAIKTQTDEKLSALMIPKAEAAGWEGTIAKLLRNAPEGSRTRAHIEAIAASKQY